MAPGAPPPPPLCKPLSHGEHGSALKMERHNPLLGQAALEDKRRGGNEASVQSLQASCNTC
eukprot:2982168-Alexandrium_andersonii.AAC.1